MQRFTLLHDGSDQGWQATYLAFYIAVRFGAPLQVLHIDPRKNTKDLKRRAIDVETGGNAAGVSVETQFLADAPQETVRNLVSSVDGFFLPQRLHSMIAPTLKGFSCPVWVVSREPETHRMAVLVDDPSGDVKVIEFANSLSNRIGLPFTILMHEENYKDKFRQGWPETSWLAVPDVSVTAIASVLKRLDAGLLTLSVSNLDLAGILPCNCIVCPDRWNA